LSPPSRQKGVVYFYYFTGRTLVISDVSSICGRAVETLSPMKLRLLLACVSATALTSATLFEHLKLPHSHVFYWTEKTNSGSRFQCLSLYFSTR